ncbi:MAG: response regulator transcription factor [Bacteroidetes bacterium]|nr:response regulator transcription factor [Bacteroidota bacterium]
MINKQVIGIILDDHKFFAESFAITLEHNGIVDIAFSFTDPIELRKFLGQERDAAILLFLDYYIPDVNILQTINDVRRIHNSVQVIILSSLTQVSAIKKILSCKPDGFISKGVGLSELADCIATINRKQQYISPDILALLSETKEESLIDLFTHKEIEVLSLLIEGLNIEEMASNLHLSRNTIIVHRRKMMAKAGVKSITALLALAIKQGLTTKDH